MVRIINIFIIIFVLYLFILIFYLILNIRVVSMKFSFNIVNEENIMVLVVVLLIFFEVGMELYFLNMVI